MTSTTSHADISTKTIISHLSSPLQLSSGISVSTVTVTMTSTTSHADISTKTITSHDITPGEINSPATAGENPSGTSTKVADRLTIVVSASSSAVQPDSSSSLGASSNHKTNVAAIVGGTLGGLLFLVLFVLGLLWYRRRQQARSHVAPSVEVRGTPSSLCHCTHTIVLPQFLERGLGNAHASLYNTMRIPLLSDDSAPYASNAVEVPSDYSNGNAGGVVLEKEKALDVPEDVEYDVNMGYAQ
jgi:hypothetical protein